MLAQEYRCNVTVRAFAEHIFGEWPCICNVYLTIILQGITIEGSQYELAQARLQGPYAHLQSTVCLLKGSATELASLFDADRKFDIIVAIDCSYHFDTRWSFLTSSLKVLSAHGQIGLFDVAIQPQAFDKTYKRWIFEKICSAGTIPLQNMVNADEYEAKLRELGFTDIQITRIDVDNVYGGLARFLKRHAASWSNAGLDLSFSNYNRLFTVARLLELLCWGKWIEPVIVTARKPEARKSEGSV
jgi:hypothetical protein